MDYTNEVYFVFEVRDSAQAEAFMNTGDAAEAGRASGVIDGEYHFAESLDL